MFAESAATDRLPFNQIARSELLRSAMRDRKLIFNISYFHIDK